MNDTQIGQKNTDSPTSSEVPSPRRGYNPPPVYKSIETLDPFDKKPSPKVVDPDTIQIGGDHYRSQKMQPIELVMANDMGFCEGSAIKYICRHHLKGGADDVKKAIHYLQLLLKHKYGKIE